MVVNKSVLTVMDRITLLWTGLFFGMAIYSSQYTQIFYLLCGQITLAFTIYLFDKGRKINDKL